MRAFVGWTLALAASALLGITVYQAVLSNPLPAPAAESLVERSPQPTPTVTQREVRTVVDPTPTVTIDDVVTVVEPAPVVAPRRTAASGGSSTRTAKPRRDDDRSPEPAERETHETEDSGQDASAVEQEAAGAETPAVTEPED